MAEKEPGACEICSEKVWGSQPICFGCFQELDVTTVQADDGTEYLISSYEYDGDEEE